VVSTIDPVAEGSSTPERPGTGPVASPGVADSGGNGGRPGVVATAALFHVDVDELLANVVDRAHELLSADTAAVLLVDSSAQTLVAAAAKGISEEIHQGVQVPIGRGFAGRVAAERHPVAVERVDADTVLNPLLWQAGIQSLLGAPLLVGDELIGVLHVGSRTPRRFSAGEREVLQLVADRAALSLHAELMRAERGTAATLQRSFLPDQPPAVDGLDLASRYVAGDQRGIVGGDWHDVLLLPSGATLLVVGDVLGRGLRAAQTMIQARTALRAHALGTEDPAELLTLLDRHIQFFHPGQLATVWCAVAVPGDDRLRMCSAGHPPPVLARPGARTEIVDVSPGVPVGVAFRGPPRLTSSVAFGPGSVLCAYTDGLVERRGRTPDVGIARLARAVTAGTATASELCAHIMAEMIGDRPSDDDVAVLVARRSPESSYP